MSDRIPPPSTTSQASKRGFWPPSRGTWLLTYNGACLALWATITLRLLVLLPTLKWHVGHPLAATYDHLFYPLLFFTQTLAICEVLHSLFGLVRAPLATTTMQVASRLLVVWGVMLLYPQVIVGGEDMSGKWVRGVVGKRAKLEPGLGMGGDLAFIGCVIAWGVTECIRYGYFVAQLGGTGIPSWLLWLRYNTFYVLYPIGISSECWLIYLTSTICKKASLYQYFLWAVLAIYIPGSYILYTHMIKQRSRVMKGKQRAR